MKPVIKKTLKIVLLTPLCLLLALILFVVCLDFYSVHFHIPSAEEKGVWTSQSPDDRFRVTAYSRSSLFDMTTMMPGQGGASRGAGIIILWNNGTGKILQQIRAENLSTVDSSNVDWMIGDPDAPWRKSWAARARLDAPWKGDYVYIMFGDTWPLPSEDGTLPPPKLGATSVGVIPENP
ncbi:MAG: hypothetical protein LBJ59_02760 [Zoogloeaceae bacterium]|jgi:hypothetical protein|nr:hypothetical protein [Zoogloeaceae bacterium]